MKRKGAFILIGSLFLVVVVLAVIVLAPLLRTYVAQIHTGRLPFVPVNLPVTNATGPTAEKTWTSSSSRVPGPMLPM